MHLIGFFDKLPATASVLSLMHYIYHIIHVENLASIFETGFLLCDRLRLENKLETKGIAHERLKERRLGRKIAVCKGGYLGDYVPFYFAPRSPMLCSIHNGKVSSYIEGQASIVHLVSSVERVVKAELPFTFSNGHAAMETAEFYENINDLDKIDWDIMRAKYWNDTPDDNNRKWRRNAEFLVHLEFPIALLVGIGVISDEIKQKADLILDTAETKIKTYVRPSYYY